MSIIHLPQKLTHAFLESEIISTPMLNLYGRYPAFSKVYESLSLWGGVDKEEYLRNNYHDPSVARNLPKPNLATHYESSPHVWWFEDEHSGVQFLFYSDGRRKNHYKGASIEIVLNDRINDADLASAYRNLFDYLAAHNQNNINRLNQAQVEPKM